MIINIKIQTGLLIRIIKLGNSNLSVKSSKSMDRHLIQKAGRCYPFMITKKLFYMESKDQVLLFLLCNELRGETTRISQMSV